MKIVQIGGALNGAQKIIEEAIHHRAIEHGYESYVFYAWGKSDEPRIVKYENKFENLITRTLRRYLGKLSCFSALQTRRLIRKIESIHPDIIHLHVLHHGCTDFNMLFKYLAKAQIPVVYTMHDMWAFTGGCYHYTSRGCAGYQRGCLNCPASVKELDVARFMVPCSYRAKRTLLEQLKRVHFVTVSDWVKQEMQNSFLAGYPIGVIHNGIDVDHLPLPAKNTESSPDAKRILLSVAASWSEKKGIHILLELAEKLGSQYQLWLVGAADEEIQKRAPANVVFLGYCRDRALLFQYYNNADLYVSASQEETFGMTFVEAAMMGTRSVGYAGTAIEETLNSVYGRAVKECSTDAYVEAIVQLFQHENQKLMTEQVAQIRDNFSIEHMAREYMELYTKEMQTD